MAANFRAILVLIVLLPVTLIMACMQIVLLYTSASMARRLPVIWHKMVLWMLGVRIFVHGEMARDRPLMIVANHVSWSDIMVLGSIGELCFIAKQEVKDWPGINWLSRLQRTVFVDRQRRQDAGIQADTIAARLLSGDAMVLFAEGTTGNGNKLLSFKSALFGAPQMALQQSGLEEIHIQPVAIAYNTLHGMPLGRYHQSFAAWPGDIELLPHLKNFVLQGAFDVDVSFGEPIAFTSTSKRKEIAALTFDEVRNRFSGLRRLYHKE